MDKTAQLKSILQLLGTSVTKGEFQDAVAQIVKYVKDIKQGNEKEWALIKSAISMLGDKLSKENSTKIDAELSRVEEKLSTPIQKALKEQEQGMKFIYDKIAAIEDGNDGEDGKDGKDADVTKIISEVLKQIPPDVEETPEQLAEKLDSIDYLKGLQDLEKRMGARIDSLPRGGARSSHSTRFTDLSTKTNGVLKVFAVPEGLSGVLFSSDFPTVMMEGNGFTLNSTRTQLTMTTVNAPSSGSQLIYQSVDIANIY